MAIPPVESFARVGGLHFFYAEAAEKSYCDYVRLSHHIEANEGIEHGENLQIFEYNKTIAGLQAVIFSAMCFEAAIYDFASIYLGDDYPAPQTATIRKQTVEHPFGTIKMWMGATHFLMRRFTNVSTEISLHILAYNLKRIISIWGVAGLQMKFKELYQ